MPPIKRASTAPRPGNIYMRKQTKGALEKTTRKDAYKKKRKRILEFDVPHSLKQNQEPQRTLWPGLLSPTP